MAVPEFDVAKIKRYCDKDNTTPHSDKLRIDFEVDGNVVTLFELRAPYDGASTEWMREDFAQFRWSPSNKLWSLYCMRGDLRWHRYKDLDPGPVDELIAEIDEDPTNIFKG